MQNNCRSHNGTSVTLFIYVCPGVFFMRLKKIFGWLFPIKNPHSLLFLLMGNRLKHIEPYVLKISI